MEQLTCIFGYRRIILPNRILTNPFLLVESQERRPADLDPTCTECGRSSAECQRERRTRSSHTRI